MLRVLEGKKEIKEAQKCFTEGMNNNAENHGSIMVGYQGGSEKLKVSWSKELGIWWGFRRVHNRFWNAFGIGEPKWNTTYCHNIACEINPPFVGIDRRISGVLAKDPDGKYYLLHRGRIGGGRKGIGKTLFHQQFRGKWIDVSDGDVISKVALVGFLEGSRFARQLADFVHEIKRIKGISKEELRPSPFTEINFTDEFSGTRAFEVESGKVEAECNHGIIVKKLAQQLEEMGMTIGNDQYVDLFVVDKNNNVKIAFEIKTNAMKTHYYAAIGQLLYHSAKLKNKPQLVAVFPHDVDKDSKRILKKLEIRCLTYKWDGNEPIFDESFRIIQ